MGKDSGTMNIKTAITIATFVGSSIVFIYGSIASSNSYTEKRIEESKRDVKEIVDLKLSAIKDDMGNIRESIKNMEMKQDKLYNAVITKK